MRIQGDPAPCSKPCAEGRAEKAEAERAPPALRGLWTLSQHIRASPEKAEICWKALADQRVLPSFTKFTRVAAEAGQSVS